MTNKKLNKLSQASVTLYQYNALTSELTSSTQVYCDVNRYIKCDVFNLDLSLIHLLSAKIKFEGYSGTNKSCYVSKITNGVINDEEFTKEAYIEGDNSASIQYLDITNLVIDESSSSFSLMIKPGNEDTSFSCSSSNVQIFLDLIEDKYSVYNNSKFCVPVGNTINCIVEPLLKKYILSTKIFSLNGGYLPIDLSINYNYLNATENNECFKFSYEQYLEVNEDVIYYFDNMFNRHTFLKSNVNSIYYDTSSPGLVLYVESNGYYISDDKTIRFDFDSNGKLTKITKQIDNNKIIENTINYLNDKIYSITDDLNRTCLFSYENINSYSYNITITKPDLTTVTVIIENNVVVSINGIVNNSLNNNGIIFTYLGNSSSHILSSVCDYTNDAIELLYNGNIGFNGYRTYVRKNTSQYQKYKQLINTYNKKIYIGNYDNNNNLLYERIIEVDDEGSVIKSYDLTNGEISNVKSIFNTPYSSHPNSNIEPQEINIELSPYVEDYNFIHDNNTINNPEIYQLIGLDTLNDKINQKYKVNFKTWFRNIKLFPYETAFINFKISIEYVINDNEIDSYEIYIPLDFSKENIVSYYEKEFSIPKSNCVNIKFYYNASGINCEMCLRNLVLTRIFSIETIDCFNKNNSEILYEYNSENYCQIAKPNRLTYISINDNSSYEVLSVDMTKTDYILTMNSYNNNSNKHHLWHSNGRYMIADVNNLFIHLDENNSFDLTNLKIATLTFFVDRKAFARTSITTNYTDVVTEEDYSGTRYSVIETYDHFGKLNTAVDSKGNTYNYTYSYSNLEDLVVEEIIGADGSRSYNQNKMIYTDDQIQLIQINSDYATISSGNGTVCTSYISKLTGQCLKIVFANNQVIEYDYKADNFSISEIKTDVGNVDNINLIEYDSNSINKVSHNGFNYALTYGNRKEITNVKVSSTNLISKSYSYAFGISSEDLTYFTGYNEIISYDKYGRLYDISSGGKSLFHNTYSNENTYNLVNNGTTGYNNADALLRVSSDGYSSTYYYYDQTDYNDDNFVEKNQDNGYKNLTKITNSRITKLYGYDSKRRIKTIKKENSHFIQKEVFTYLNGDKYNRDLIDSNLLTYRLSTDTNVNLIYSSKSYDSLSRVTHTSLLMNNNYSFDRYFNYAVSEGYTSSFINNITYKTNGQVFDSEDLVYDSLGNISQVKYTNGTMVEYFYDNIGRLIRENNPIIQKTYTYVYDAGGNLVTKKEYDYTRNDLNGLTALNTFIYEYDSVYKDKLSKINSDNLSYLNNEVLLSSYKNHSFTWSKRNKLTAHFNSSTGNRTEYKYNEKGQRIQKNVRVAPNLEKEIYYVYDGDKLLEELVTKKVLYPTGNNGNDLLFKNIYYLYDGDNLIGFNYNNSLYYYSYDCLGNIKYILDSTCNVIAKYEYDAWGNHIVYQKTSSGYIQNNSDTFIGNLNSIRYKKYYYDVETGLFWLSSRYYSPELCRFISPDDVEYLEPESVNGLNLYCYCKNNPIMYFDPSGHFTIASMLISIGVSLLFEVLEDAIDGGLGDGSHDWKDYLGAGISGFFGGLSPVGGTLLKQIGSQLVFSLAGGFADAAISGDLIENGFWNTMGSIAVSTMVSMGAGTLSKYLGSKIKASTLRSLGSNNAANKVLGRMGVAGKIGGKTNSALASMIRNSNWLGNIVADYGASSIMGRVSSMGWSHIFDGRWF